MTKFILIIWLFLIHGIALLALIETDLAYRIDRKLGIGLITSKELTPLYKEMVGSHQQLDGSVVNGSVLFFGDSITQGLNVASIAHPAINYGIGMDTSYGLLSRLDQYSSLSRASHIVIAIGVNDLIRTHRNNGAILDNFQRIFDRLPADVTITLSAILPVDERVTSQNFNLRVNAINDGLKKLAESKEAHFIDISPQLTNDQGNLQAQYHIGDGLHLSTPAYQLWINTLNQHLQSIGH